MSLQAKKAELAEIKADLAIMGARTDANAVVYDATIADIADLEAEIAKAEAAEAGAAKGPASEQTAEEKKKHAEDPNEEENESDLEFLQEAYADIKDVDALATRAGILKGLVAALKKPAGFAALTAESAAIAAEEMGEIAATTDDATAKKRWKELEKTIKAEAPKKSRTPRASKTAKTAEDVATKPVQFVQDEKCDHLPWEETGLPGVFHLEVKPGSEIVTPGGRVVQTAQEGETLFALGEDCGRLIFAEKADFAGQKSAWTRLQNAHDKLAAKHEKHAEALKAAREELKAAKEEATEKVKAAKEEATEKVKAAKEEAAAEVKAARESAEKARAEAREHKAASAMAGHAIKQAAEVQAGHRAAEDVEIMGPVLIQYGEMARWGANALFNVRDDDGKIAEKGGKKTAAEVRKEFADEFAKPELYHYSLELVQSPLVKLKKSDLRELDAADRPANNMTAAQRDVVLDMVDDVRKINVPFAMKDTIAYQKKVVRVLRLREDKEEKDIILEHYNGTYTMVASDGEVTKTTEPKPGSYVIVTSEAALRPLEHRNPHEADHDTQVDCIHETLAFLGKEIDGRKLRKLCGTSDTAKNYRRAIYAEASKIHKAEGGKYHHALAKAWDKIDG
jgi:hypothetical protein